jgi:ssDNA-binding Zn-finger/Zn-ribbon topoisomerase 1
MRQLILEGTQAGIECACGGEFLVRTMREIEHQFLGCSRWPECAETREIPASMLMAKQLEFYAAEIDGRMLMVAMVDPETRDKYRFNMTWRRALRIGLELIG